MHIERKGAWNEVNTLTYTDTHVLLRSLNGGTLICVFRSFFSPSINRPTIVTWRALVIIFWSNYTLLSVFTLARASAGVGQGVVGGGDGPHCWTVAPVSQFFYSRFGHCSCALPLISDPQKKRAIRPIIAAAALPARRPPVFSWLMLEMLAVVANTPVRPQHPSYVWQKHHRMSK